MEWLNWKTILALAVLVVPLAYCEMDAQRQRSAEKIACIEHGGVMNLRNNCEIEQ
jgi:hypothetical protein